MKSGLSEGFRNGIPEGSLQARLTLLAQNCAPVNKPLVEGTRATGDHTAGLAVILKQMGIIGSLENAMPTFGATTRQVRSGTDFIVNPANAEFFRVPTGAAIKNTK